MKPKEGIPEESIELAKLKEEQLKAERDKDAISRTDSNDTVTQQNAVRSCSPSRWVDKTCLVMFPALYIAFNCGYWFHYLP